MVWEYPKDYKKVEQQIKYQTPEGITVLVEGTDRCGDIAIPCVYHLQRKDLHSFSDDLKDGFYMHAKPWSNDDIKQ
ncbi:hypothetical protein GCM10023331_18880 [Algivirga pacifica]|uniref:Uncharacterized protein n=2 Tax=Algivirga pacifica TaxID=1162670 RepID=A0ABP9DC00_9BACT